MANQINTQVINTAMDLLIIADRDLKRFRIELNSALSKLGGEFDLEKSAEYKRIEQLSVELVGGLLDMIWYFRKNPSAGDDVTISLPRDFASKAEVAAGDMPYVLGQASQTLTHLHSQITSNESGNIDSGIMAAMAMSGRGLGNIAETEGLILEQLARHISKGLSEKQTATIALAA